MDRTESTLRLLLSALPSPGYELGILSANGMQRRNGLTSERLLRLLPYLKHRNATGAHIFLRPAGESAYTLLDDLSQQAIRTMTDQDFAPAAVVETSPGNFQAWLRHSQPLSKNLGTLAARMLATRFGADHGAADWRRFGRAPGFTNRKPQHRSPAGLYPYAKLVAHAGGVFAVADAFHAELTALHQQEKESQAARTNGFKVRACTFPPPSLLHFRNSTRYAGRPAAADMAFSICAVSRGLSEAEIADALRSNYLSRNPSKQAQAAYIRRTLTKALRWAA